MTATGPRSTLTRRAAWQALAPGLYLDYVKDHIAD